MFVCGFGLLSAIGLTLLDKKADQVDGESAAGKISEDEKFRWRDLKKFGLAYWLIVFSCVLTYMAIFPFMQVVTDML